MRKLIVAGLMLAAAVGVAPSQASHFSERKFTFKLTSAPVPCTAWCTYWQPHDGKTVYTEALIGEGGESFSKYACTAPGPDLSFADKVVRAPTGARWLQFTIYPTLEWDSFICLRTSTKTKRAKFLMSGANGIDPNCLGIGCVETATVRVTRGKYYILRVYNWSDSADLPATYRWLR